MTENTMICQPVPKVHISHATLCVLSFMGCTIMDIALSILTIMTTIIILAFSDSLLPPDPHYFWAQLGTLNLIHPTEQHYPKVWPKETDSNKALQMHQYPLILLHHIELVKGMYSGTSHSGGLSFTQHTHSSTAVFPSLKIPSSTLS